MPIERIPSGPSPAKIRGSVEKCNRKTITKSLPNKLHVRLNSGRPTAVPAKTYSCTGTRNLPFPQSPSPRVRETSDAYMPTGTAVRLYMRTTSSYSRTAVPGWHRDAESMVGLGSCWPQKYASIIDNNTGRDQLGMHGSSALSTQHSASVGCLAGGGACQAAVVEGQLEGNEGDGCGGEHRLPRARRADTTQLFFRGCVRLGRWV
jgi:hypothetical protein